MSLRRTSKEGFRQLPDHNPPPMPNPKDATIDIPLTPVTAQAQNGSRRAAGSVSPSVGEEKEYGGFAPLNEKSHTFHHAPGGRRRIMEEKGRGNTSSEDGTLTAMGKVYTAIFHFSVITRYFLYVLPLALIIAAPIVVGATAAKSATIGGVRIVWFFTWVEVVWLSLWVSKLVAQALPTLFQFLCGIVSAGTRKYALVLTKLEIPLSLVGWAVTCLTTFVPLMCLNADQRQHNDTGLRDWESIVKNILFAALFATLILLAEKLLVQLISISYHRKQFDEKIQQSKRNIHLLSLLYDASRNLFPAYCPEFSAEDYIIHNALDLRGGPGGGSSQWTGSGTATPGRFVQNVGRVGDKLTAAVGNVAQEITGKHVFNPTSAHSIVVEALEKTSSSEALAKRIWISFVRETENALYLEDINDVLGSNRSPEAEECFECLDRDGNGDVSLDEMVTTVCEFGRERYSITTSMHDVDQAINVLDNLLCSVAFIIIVFVFVAFLNRNFTTTLATAGTALLSLSFVFASTCQEVLGSCIFLFVKHPFDVGDRVDIDDVSLVVERISLLFTIFRKVKDHKCTQVPNIVLNSRWIDNVTRSKAMREQVFIYINADTTLEDIQLLKNDMHAFVLDKDNSRDFQPDIDVEVTSLAEMDKLELKIEMRHKSNWANETIRAGRRSKFMCALVLALRKIPIYGPGAGGAPAGDPANPTYSVAISHELAEWNKKDFTKSKAEKRMVPMGSVQRSSTVVGSPQIFQPSGIELTPSKHAPLKRTAAAAAAESWVVDSLNARNAASDPVRDVPKIHSPVNNGSHSGDLQQIQNILRRESVTGRRRANSKPQMVAAPSSPNYAPPTPPIPEIRQPTAENRPTTAHSTASTLPPPPIAKSTPPPSIMKAPPSRVDYYEDPSPVISRPSTAGSLTALPQHPPPLPTHPTPTTSNTSPPLSSNNPYIPPRLVGTPYSASAASTASRVELGSAAAHRRPVPGNAQS